ncbi:hypothetical protein ACIKTA_13300, partial [Hansschlegelia beijingensis]
LMVDDILDVIEEEADEDLRALGGVTGDEEISDPVLIRAACPEPTSPENALPAAASPTTRSRTGADWTSTERTA